MKRCAFFTCVLLTVIAATNVNAEWSIKPYAQISAGVNLVQNKIKEHNIHHWQNWAYSAAQYYFIYDNKHTDSDKGFGNSFEIGGDFHYEWFYAALGLNYNTGGNIVKNWSALSLKLGGTYKFVTPYVKLGALLHNKTKFGSMDSGIVIGVGTSIKIHNNLYIDISYDMNKLKHHARLDGYYIANAEYANNLFPGGSFGTEEEMKYFAGHLNYRLDDITKYSYDIKNHTIRTGLKYVF